MEVTAIAAREAEVIHEAFDRFRHRFRSVTRRVRERFERRDWSGIREDTVERLGLHGSAVRRTIEVLEDHLGEALHDRVLWGAMKQAYRRSILGRDDFELAQTYFNSLTRKIFTHDGVDPAIDFISAEFPLPYTGWEMASARMYAVQRVDAGVVQRMLEDAGFHAPFRDLTRDATLAAQRLEAGFVETFGDLEIEALDVLRPIFVRNKAAYVVGRARRGRVLMPVVLALIHDEDGLAVDAVLSREDDASILFSFARWYFHVDVEAPREVIGFLHSILPRKRVAELYISIGHNKHGKTEFYGDLMQVIAASDDPLIIAPGQRGLVMEVFTLEPYEFVFKVIKDTFPPSKRTSRRQIRDRYRQVFLHDRVGRLVDFQEFEHLSFPRERFDPELLAMLLETAAKTVSVRGEEVVVNHLYVGRRVEPLDLFLAHAAEPEAVDAVVDWGDALKELAAANIFPGDLLLKNFGLTRHGRVVSYDYDELTLLTDCRFRRMPPPRGPGEELSDEPWFGVGDDDIFPEEIGTFLELDGPLREVFLARHADLLEVEFWRDMQERNRRDEVIDFYPYPEQSRLHPETGRPAGRLTVGVGGG